MKMLSKEEYEKSLYELSLITANNTEDDSCDGCSCMSCLPSSECENAKLIEIFNNLIKEHFEIIEDNKKLQDEVDYYKHEYYAMCDLVENNEVKKCNDMTICETLEAISELTQNDEVEKMLNYIEERVGAMEDRLLAYCNAIESLGFKRIGRDYEKQ